MRRLGNLKWELIWDILIAKSTIPELKQKLDAENKESYETQFYESGAETEL